MAARGENGRFVFAFDFLRRSPPKAVEPSSSVESNRCCFGFLRDLDLRIGSDGLDQIKVNVKN